MTNDGPFERKIDEIEAKALRDGIDNLSEKEFMLYITAWQTGQLYKLFSRSIMVAPANKREVVVKIIIPTATVGGAAGLVLGLIQALVT